ncbi:MAG: sacC 2 [Frondihabitans sp.]|nr:sacC 2 [Frondihabitans sp.]
MFRSLTRLQAISAAAITGALLLTGLTATSSVADTSLYHEPYRPQFHFSLPSGWIGDPNGLVYDDGLYYLFSYGTWQGAVSTDLVHWKDIPVTGPEADPGSDAFYSGSAVVDTNNTSGFGSKTNPAMVAFYTSVQAGTDVEKQSLAYSTDHGRTWTRYSGNPILDLDSVNFRDPKVFWYAPKHEWVMAVTLSDQYKVSIYTSPNLKTWTHESDFGPRGATTGVWEMPDLYSLPVDGNPRKTKWVLSVSVGSTGVQYFTGGFDGNTFTADGSATYAPPPGMTVADFESGDYSGWTSSGTAFGATPAAGALPDQQTVSGYQGTYLANSYNGGDGSTGTLTSAPFTLDKSHLNFLIGGGDNPYVPGSVPAGTVPNGTVFADFSGSTYGTGWSATGAFANAGPTTESLPNQIGASVLDTYTPDGDPGTGTISSPTFTVNSSHIDLQLAGGDHPWGQSNPTSVNLVVGGKVVETATGGGSSTLNWTNWDTSAYQGQKAQIQVVDDNDGSAGWGHIMVGDIVFADEAASPWDTQTSVNLLVDGTVVRSATGGNSEALDWTSWNLSDIQGKQAQIQIVDDATGGWGHILADDFTLSNSAALNQVQRANWLDYGADFYAENTWNNVPNGQRIAIAWMNNWAYASAVPTSPWQGAETFPRTLSLRTIDGKPRVVEQPVSGINQLRTGNAYKAKNVTLTDTTTPLGTSGQTLDIEAHLTAGSAATFGLNVHTGSGQYTQIGYDTSSAQLYIDRSHSGNVTFSPAFTTRSEAPLQLNRGGLDLRVLVDTSSIEVFGADGQVVLTDQILPDATSTGVSAFATGGTAHLDQLRSWQLKSIWK